MEPSDLDPFQHFEDVERSWAALQKLGKQLAKEAAELLASVPDAQVVGLIAEAGAPDYVWLRTEIEQATGQKLSPNGFAGLVPVAVVMKAAASSGRAQALQRLTEQANAALERRLPVIACTVHGIRMGWIAIPRAPKSPQ